MIIIIYNLKEGRKCFYLTTHSTHFIYGYMASDMDYNTTVALRTPYVTNQMLILHT